MTKKKPSTRDHEIGRRIRARRVAIGMSQSKLGQRLGVTFQQVQKYEKGLNRIGSGRLEELARILDVPITFFYDDANTGDGDVSRLLKVANTMQALKLLRAYSAIQNPKLRQALVDLATQLASSARED